MNNDNDGYDGCGCQLASLLPPACARATGRRCRSGRPRLTRLPSQASAPDRQSSQWREPARRHHLPPRWCCGRWAIRASAWLFPPADRRGQITEPWQMLSLDVGVESAFFSPWASCWAMRWCGRAKLKAGKRIKAPIASFRDLGGRVERHCSEARGDGLRWCQ